MTLVSLCPSVQLVHVRHLQDGVLLWMQTLTEVRSEVAKKLGLQEEDLELSMGMSGDFEQAVSHPTDVALQASLLTEKPF